MAEHNDLGKSGENAAVAYLEQKGYLIREIGRASCRERV